MSDDDLLRKRLAHAGTVGGGLGLVACAVRLLRCLVEPLRPACLPSYLWHLAAAGVLLVLPWYCRAPRKRTHLLVADAVAFPASALGYGLMGRNMAILDGTQASAVSAQVTVLLAISYGVFARAVYVPSTGARTFAITAACLPGVLASGRFGSVTAVGGAIMWWMLAIVVTTLASNVIYGLRREVSAVREYGQYTLEEKLGEGGMGIVYQARHAMLRRPTAVKLLPPGLAGGTSIARFEKEVRLTARLTHPNTVTIFDYGRTPDGVFYYAMELLDGETLEDIVAVTGPLALPRVLRVARQIAAALAEAHALGLVHRDVKPANIMLCQALGGEPDVAKVLDFGLVRDQNATDLGHTATNAFAGTPLYMSPEAITDPATISASSDLYALGAVIWFLLVGEPVFDAATTIEICASHLHAEPTAPSRRSGRAVPPALERLVLACLSKLPQDRPRSARELVAALDAIGAEERWDERDAAAWWREHRAEIKRYRLERTPRSTVRGITPSRALAVDFGLR